MAHLTGFHYRPGSSRLHRLDVRVKLALLAAAALVSLELGAAGLALLAILVCGALAAGRCRPRCGALERRTVAPLLALVFFGRALSTPGETLLTLGPLALTLEGLREGTLGAARLGFVFLIGAAFVATTRPSEIKAGIEWLLRPLPAVNARRAGAAVGLMVRFIPVVWEQAAAVAEAQRARAVERRRNPVARAVLFGAACMRRILLSAETLALAMEARGYRDDRTGPELAARRVDGVILIVAAVILAALLLLAPP